MAAAIDVNENLALEIDYDGEYYLVKRLTPTNLPYWEQRSREVAANEKNAVKIAVGYGADEDEATKAVAKQAAANAARYKDVASPKELARWNQWAARAN